MRRPGPYTPEAGAAGCRALRLACLGLMARTDGGAAAAKLFAEADNMTEQVGALGALLQVGAGAEEAQRFYRQWQHDRLVIDKWFALQLMQAAPGDALPLAQDLVQHSDFDWKNPNRFRSVLSAFAGNHAAFHAGDGGGYGFVADWLIRLDPVNPQTAARMSTVFDGWTRYDADRQALARAALERIRGAEGLSRDMGEMVGRLLLA